MNFDGTFRKLKIDLNTYEIGLRTYFLDFQLIILTLLAGIVALFGLFLNNVAVIIGAMVISPLLEPIYAGTVFLAEEEMSESSLNI